MAVESAYWIKIASYLNGELSDPEKASLEKWISSSEEHKASFLEAKKIWENATVQLRYPQIDSKQFLTHVISGIGKDTQRGWLIPLLDRPVWKIAASLTLVLISYLVIRWVTRENITISAGNEIATLYLPDSTKVWLNINSQIVYPRAFKSRELRLSGEAFLSVRKDTSSFTVLAGPTRTDVLGTAFNLKEQPDSSVTLTVAEGTVKFAGSDSIGGQAVVVKAQEKSTFKKQSRLTRSRNDDPSFAKWREQNNPAFEEEKNKPSEFLSNTYTWKKNQINQSVIEGMLTNSASLAAYTKIIFEVTYSKPDGTPVIVDITINDTVYPGKRLPYKRRLLDLFSDTKSIVVKLKSASVTTKDSF